MIDIKEAVRIASEYLTSLYSAELVRDMLLEEVERSVNESCWLITLGFSRPIPETEVAGVIQVLSGKQFKREYKVMEIDASTGEVRSMKIRTP